MTRSKCRFAFGGTDEGHGWKERQKSQEQQRRNGRPPYQCLPALTTGGEGVLEHLVELSQVHHHRQLVGLPHWGHFFACHDGRNAQFLLSNIKSQLVILLHILLIQRVKISKKQDEKNRSRRLVFTLEKTGSMESSPFLSLLAKIQDAIWEPTYWSHLLASFFLLRKCKSSSRRRND